MANAIFKVDDGSIWHFDADDHEDAYAKWVAAMMEQGYTSEKAVLADFDKPTITRVQLVAAATIKVRMEDMFTNCSHCGGTGKVPATLSLLELWQHEQTLPIEKRSHLGILGNSEW